MAEPALRRFVKICGVTTPKDAALVVASGADALGVIFADSPRGVDVATARAIASLAEGALVRVGVFRHRGLDEVARVLDQVELDAVQVHDPLGAELLAELRARGLTIIKALSVDSVEFATFDDRVVDAVLIDGPRPGSGTTHSWEALGQRSFDVPLIAAGGLNPSNVAATIESTRATGVDCASGVESAPGHKDPHLVDSFVANARAAFARQEETC